MPEFNIPNSGVIKKTAVVDIVSPVQRVFGYISAEESLPKFLKKYGPVHAVTGAKMHKGPWSVPGAYRTLHFDSGDTLREELLVFQPFSYFAYCISDFSNVTKYLCHIAYGEFNFKPLNGTTQVSWTYSFKPRNFLTSILLSAFMSLYFKKYMQQGLQLAKEDIERQHSIITPNLN